jgi:hypothetical protein
MTMITVQCPCGKRLRAKDESAGRVARCPGCGAMLDVPMPDMEILVEQDFPDQPPSASMATVPAGKPPAIPEIEGHPGIDEATRDHVARRVGALRWQMAGVGVACLIAGYMAGGGTSARSHPEPVGPARFDQIEARGITIVDREGRPRMLLKASPWQVTTEDDHDDAFLTMLNSAGEQVVELKTAGDVRTDLTIGGHGRQDVVLGSTEFVSYLGIKNPSKEPGGSVDLQAGIFPMVTLNDSESRPRVGLRSYDDGGLLWLFDRKGESPVTLEYRDGKRPNMVLKASDGKVVEPYPGDQLRPE